MQTTARSEVQTADVFADLQSRGKVIIDVAPTVTASGIHSIWIQKRERGQIKKYVSVSGKHTRKLSPFSLGAWFLRRRTAAAAAQWSAIKISLPMREIYNPVAQNHLLPCVTHANDAGTQLEYQILQQRASPEELRLRQGGLAELCPDRRHYPGIWLKRNPSFQICQHKIDLARLLGVHDRNLCCY